MTPRAVLGIDPGRRWTAGVLRVGDLPVDGWTLGPTGSDGLLDPSATDDAHDLAAFGRYQRRVLDEVEATVERYRAAGGGPVWLACEVTVPPGGRRIPIADWLVPRQLLAGLQAYDPDVLLIQADGHGKHHAAGQVAKHYPPELCPRRGGVGGRPATWGPNEARRGERDHERAAYDIGGSGLKILASRDRAAAALPDPTGGTAG